MNNKSKTHDCGAGGPEDCMDGLDCPLRHIETIDITPTWEGLLPALVHVAVNGTSTEGRETAWTELRKLARLADSVVAGKWQYIKEKP